jgi:hypothetical protein
MSMSLSLRGFDVGAWLTGIDIGKQKRIIRDGLEMAVKPMIADAKSRAPKRTGALKRSMGVVLRHYPNTNTFLAVVGPQNMRVVQVSGKAGRKRLRKANSTDEQEDVINPGKYGHLVEFGHVSANGGGAMPNFGERVPGVWNSVNKNKSIRAGTLSGTSYVSPRPFLTPAFEANKGNAQTAIGACVLLAMEAETKRLTRRLSTRVSITANA